MRLRRTFGAILMMIGDATRMLPYTTKKEAKITAGAVASLVIVGWIVVLALGFLSA